jgi:hypothetical protein
MTLANFTSQAARNPLAVQALSHMHVCYQINGNPGMLYVCAIFVLHMHMCYQINTNPGILIEAFVLSFGLKFADEQDEALKPLDTKLLQHW